MIYLPPTPTRSLFFTPDDKLFPSSNMEEVRGRVIKVEMVVTKGKFRGMRGALYKLAGEHGAYRLQSVPDAVCYGNTAETSTDIVMDLYFLDDTERTKFIAEVKKTLRIPDVLRKCSPDYNPKV